MFGETLRSVRRLSGHTQEDLSAASGVSVRNIRDLETGRIARPRPATVRRLADALGLTADDRAAFLADAMTDGPATPAPSPARPRPAQLPADTAVFVGRDAELERLDLGGTGTGGPAVWTVTGPAGVGKTCFAVHWAHRSRERFPDGQLYVNMRGFGPGDKVPPPEAVRGFLDALGVPPASVPTDPAAQLTLYRSVLADKRVLILLDNARDAAQVRPLLPASPGCVVVVTSRNPLRGLVATDGARPVRLEMFSPAEATRLLTRRVGADRLDGHTTAVRAIVDRCQRLPLALAVVAGRLVSEPRLTATRVAGDLAAAGMAAFASDDEHTDLRSVFSWSYEILSPAAARLFRLLSLNPGPDWSTTAAEALAGGPVGELLAELQLTQLLVEKSPGRYTMHDLLRAYAAEVASADEDPAAIREARGRLLDVYLMWASAAQQRLEPFREPVDELPPELFADAESAIAWLVAERPNLLALVRMAAANDFPGRAWRLAAQLTTFLQRRGHWFDLLHAHEVALKSASSVDDLRGEMHAHRGLARALFRLQRWGEARVHMEVAVKHAVQLGDVLGEARARHGIGYADQQLNQQESAFEQLGIARDLFASAGNLEGVANALNSIAFCHTLVGTFEEAREAAEQSVKLFGSLDNPHGQAVAMDTAGLAYAGLGDFPRAVKNYGHARQVFRDLGDRYSEAEALQHLAEAHDAAGDAAAARSARRRSDSILSRVDKPEAGRTDHRITRGQKK